MGAPVVIKMRKAVEADIPRMRELIEASVRGLQMQEYTQSQIELALRLVYGVDTRLIADGTYFAAEVHTGVPYIVGCGGWGKRKTLYGGDVFSGREDALLEPGADPATIRAFFVDPAWARRGIGSMILDASENEAMSAGFTRFEMGATLTGVPFYRARGYVEQGHVDAPLPNGEMLSIIRMTKCRPRTVQPGEAAAPRTPI